MLKNILVAISLSLYGLNCAAQIDSVKTKMFNHYIGIQVNQLIKQVINLNNSNSVINNPYLLIYNIHSAKKGWGLNTGLGYSYTKVTDKNAGDKVTETKDLSFRIGIGRRVMLGKKVEAGYGLDFVNITHTDKSSSSLITTFGNFADSTATTVTNKTNGVGAGAQLNIAFHITEKVLIGTEATGYFIKSKNKQEVNVFTLETNLITNTNTQTTETSTKETDTDTFTFSVPVAIFLIVKF